MITEAEYLEYSRSGLNYFHARTLFETASISGQEEHRGTGELQRAGLLGVQTLSIEVEPICRVE